MTWSEVTVDGSEILGYEPSDFIDDDTDVIDDELITDAVVNAARGTVRDLLATRLNEMVIQVGENALFDMIADSVSVRPRLKQAMLFAFLHHFYRSNYILGGDSKLEKSEYYWVRLTTMIKPMADLIRVTLSSTDTDIDAGLSGSTYQRTTTDWWGI